MNKNYNKRRRDFIKKSLLASSIFIVPRHVLGGSDFISPSDRLNIAAIASGGKGGSDISNASVSGRENIIALCDVDFSGDAAKTVKKFPKAKLYADFRKMLDHVEKNSPLKRNVTIQQVGDTASFLASDGASGITGQTIYVDSGFNIIGMPSID